jgi:hypothetical protein
MSIRRPLTSTLPTVAAVRERMGGLLRELQLLRGLERLAAKAEHYRNIEQSGGQKVRA